MLCGASRHDFTNFIVRNRNMFVRRFVYLFVRMVVPPFQLVVSLCHGVSRVDCVRRVHNMLTFFLLLLHYIVELHARTTVGQSRDFIGADRLFVLFFRV